MILMKIDKIKGDCKIKGFEDHFTCESCGFGIAREVADSAKAGTADIVFGVGELQEVSINKSMDMGSPYLATFAMRGATVGTVDIFFVEVATTADNKTVANIFLQMHLQNAFIKTWNISGDADGRPTEDLTMWYNGIAFTWYWSKDGKTFTKENGFAWDHVTNKPWEEGKSKLRAAGVGANMNQVPTE